jgi:hypothetical protein
VLAGKKNWTAIAQTAPASLTAQDRNTLQAY